MRLRFDGLGDRGDVLEVGDGLDGDAWGVLEAAFMFFFFLLLVG